MMNDIVLKLLLRTMVGLWTTHIRTHTYVYKYSTYTYTCIHMFMCVCVCVCVCVCMCVCVCVCIHTYIARQLTTVTHSTKQKEDDEEALYSP